jgi:large subunit ribosomal protein L22
MKATLKNARISPKKLRVIANLVRGKSVDDGLAMLRLFSKKGGDILYKVLFSAASNAIHNDGATKTDLVIHALSIAQGPVYKRARPVGRGRSHRIIKRTSHVFLELAHK